VVYLVNIDTMWEKGFLTKISRFFFQRDNGTVLGLNLSTGFT